jgi:hypothetical protein
MIFGLRRPWTILVVTPHAPVKCMRQAMQAKPSTRHSAAVQVRLRGTAFTSLENWRRSHPKIPSRSEAMRLLIEHALEEMSRGLGPKGAYAPRSAPQSRPRS